jgi:hypothetical protein
MKRKIALTLALLVMSLGTVAGANAQKGKLFKGVDWKKMAEAARRGNTNADKTTVARIDEAYAEKESSIILAGQNALVGTWYITVPGPTPEENFYAYQTFGADGTFVETSSLLATLTEGPAHGVWEKARRGFVLTFELFAFDPESRSPVGRVRVRNYLQVADADHFTSDSAVDFIELDGTVIPNIATGPFSGERVQLRGIN